MKNTMMICLALFAAFGCTGQSKAGKGKTQELTTMENQKEIYLAVVSHSIRLGATKQKLLQPSSVVTPTSMRM